MAGLSLASVSQPPGEGRREPRGDWCLLAVCPLVSGIPCSQGKIPPKYYILDSVVDYEGYSISSKEFLSTVVDIMVI